MRGGFPRQEANKTGLKYKDHSNSSGEISIGRQELI